MKLTIDVELYIYGIYMEKWTFQRYVSSLKCIQIERVILKYLRSMAVTYSSGFKKYRKNEVKDAFSGGVWYFIQDVVWIKLRGIWIG